LAEKGHFRFDQRTMTDGPPESSLFAGIILTDDGKKTRPQGRPEGGGFIR